MYSKYLREHEYFFKHTHRGDISACVQISRKVRHLQTAISYQQAMEGDLKKCEICEIYHTENAPFLASSSSLTWQF